MEHWKLAREKRQSVAVLSTDMSKAFDSLHPPLMLSKLRAYSFEENTLNLLRFYRTDRRNRVKLGPVKSNWPTVNRGCPQGSALGPLLWNIFENDLTCEIKSDVSMYSDDHQKWERILRKSSHHLLVVQKRHPDSTKSTYLKETFPNTRPC